MKQQSNDQVLLRELLKQELSENIDYSDEGEFFEFFASSQKLKEYELSDEEIQKGIKGSGLDGGCDSIYLFYNNVLMNEETVPFII